MSNTDVMQRDPVRVPSVPGVFALANKKRRFAYVAWTQNLQKRSHALAHMLDSGKSTIKALPIHDPSEYTFIVLKENVDNVQAERSIAQLKRPFVDRSYSFVEGSRSPVPMVSLDGKQITLAEAIAGTSIKYTTAWRRLQRGWTIEATLGREPPPPRWGR